MNTFKIYSINFTKGLLTIFMLFWEYTLTMCLQKSQKMKFNTMILCTIRSKIFGMALSKGLVLMKKAIPTSKIQSIT